MTGKFVVFEGIDGSGKSTTVQEVAERLRHRAATVSILREPTEKTDASREIRRILRSEKIISPAINLHLLELFLIDRLWDIKNQIEPALQRGDIVLLDRYYLSTAAYQARDNSQVSEIISNYSSDHRIPVPDLVVHLDIAVDIATRRLAGRSERDAFETEARLRVTRQNYLSAFNCFRATFPSVDILCLNNELKEVDFDGIATSILGLKEKVSDA